MANPNMILIDALRKAALQLREGAFYAWGHHGACNCGNLLQVVTTLSKEDILAHAHTGPGEWTELAEESCQITGTPAALLIQELERIGLTTSDIHHIEYLTDRAVLNHLEGGFRWLKRNVREDVIAYFEAFARMLEDQLAQSLPLNVDELLAPMKTERMLATV
jgi:hypothetical protein